MFLDRPGQHKKYRLQRSSLQDWQNNLYVVSRSVIKGQQAERLAITSESIIESMQKLITGDNTKIFLKPIKLLFELADK